MGIHLKNVIYYYGFYYPFLYIYILADDAKKNDFAFFDFYFLTFFMFGFIFL